MHKDTKRAKRILAKQGVRYQRIYNDKHQHGRTIKFYALDCSLLKAARVAALIYAGENNARVTSGYPYTANISISITIPRKSSPYAYAR